jgi:hypothetical protein
MDTLAHIYNLLGEVALLPIPLREKGPRFRGWQSTTFESSQEPKHQERLRSAVHAGGNIGVLLSGDLVAIDLDNDEVVEQFLSLNPMLSTTLRSKGARGAQIWIRVKGDRPIRGKITLNSKAVGEWRCDGFQSVIYGQHPEGMRYQLLAEGKPVEVSFGDITWPEGYKLPGSIDSIGEDDLGSITDDFAHTEVTEQIRMRITAYLSRIDPAIDGDGGSSQTSSVAKALIQDWGLSAESSMEFMRLYNSKCEPPWDESELWRKLDWAVRHGVPQNGRVRGHLEGNDAAHARVVRPDSPFTPKEAVELTEKECASMTFIECLQEHSRRNGYEFRPSTPEEMHERVQQALEYLHLVEIGGRKAPDFDSFDDLMNEDIPEPKRIIDGILGKGQKMSVNGSSKDGKTWILLYLAICMSLGREWLGRCVAKSKILYVNFELPRFFLKQRLEILKNRFEVEKVPNLITWTLRGFYPDPLEFKKAIISKMQGQEFDVIFADPVYKIMNGADECDAGEIALMLSNLEEIATETDCAFIYAHHFSKGSQDGKDSLDRSSGSGVFGRDPDTIITMTKHKKDDCRTVDVTVRNYKAVESFVVKWNTADCCYELAEGEDPKNLRTPNTDREFTMDEAVGFFHIYGGMTKKDFIARSEKSSPTVSKVLHAAVLEKRLENPYPDFYCLPGTAPKPVIKTPQDLLLEFLRAEQRCFSWGEIQIFANDSKISTRLLGAHIDGLIGRGLVRSIPLRPNPKTQNGFKYEAAPIYENGQMEFDES